MSIPKMATYRFYQIKSQKSLEYQNGLRQITLNCESNPQIYCFVWINKAEEMEHIQFVFNENIIEWFKEQGISVGQTNRKMFAYSLKTGIHKGARTIHETQSDDILEDGTNIIMDSEFPEDFQSAIQEKILDQKAS